jgi:YD repeat-containing protein
MACNVDIGVMRIPHHVSTTGEVFPEDSPKSYTYDGSGNIETVTATWEGETYLKTLTYNAGKLASETGWVKQ